MIKTLALILLLSIPCQAVISRVQFKSGVGNVGSLVITLTSSPTDGNTLVAGIGIEASNVSGITQTGATWTRATRILAAGATTEIWYASNVSGAGTTVTIGLVAAPTLRVGAVVAEYSGADPVPLDQVVSSSGDWSSVAPSATGPTTVLDSEAWFAVVADKGGSAAWNDASSGYIEIAEEATGSSNTDISTAQDDKVASGIGALSASFTKTPTPTIGAWAESVASFKSFIPHMADPMPMIGIGG